MWNAVLCMNYSLLEGDGSHELRLQIMRKSPSSNMREEVPMHPAKTN